MSAFVIAEILEVMDEEAYRDLKALRQRAARTNMILIEGRDVPR